MPPIERCCREFNRFNERPLIFAHPRLYGFHISSVFSSTDPNALIEFSRIRPGIEVTESDKYETDQLNVIDTQLNVDSLNLVYSSYTSSKT